MLTGSRSAAAPLVVRIDDMTILQQQIDDFLRRDW